MQHTDFSLQDLSYSKFHKAIMKTIEMFRVSMTHSTFQVCVFDFNRYEHCDFDFTTFDACDFTKTDFKNCKWPEGYELTKIGINQYEQPG
jgi:uncharacterized protein YjbI with pentapeptide repeats